MDYQRTIHTEMGRRLGHLHNRLPPAVTDQAILRHRGRQSLPQSLSPPQFQQRDHTSRDLRGPALSPKIVYFTYISKLVDKVMLYCAQNVGSMSDNSRQNTYEHLQRLEGERYLESDLSLTLWADALRQMIDADPTSGQTASLPQQPFIFLVFRAFEKLLEDLEECVPDEEQPVTKWIRQRIDVLKDGIGKYNPERALRMVQKNQVELTKFASSITAVVLVFTFLSFIPLCVGFAKSPARRGTIDDADFWFLFQNSLMQILGFVILVFTLLEKSWHSHAWDWWWAVCCLGFGCAIGSNILYLYTPQGWSAVVSFLATAFQAGMTLLWMHAVVNAHNERKTKSKSS